MGLAAFKQREEKQQGEKVEHFLTQERAVLFSDLSKADAEAGAHIKRLRKSLREPKIKHAAATRALDSARVNHDRLAREVEGIDARIAEIFERQRHQRGKLHAQIMKVSPIAQDFVARVREEAYDLEQGTYNTKRITTGRKNALGDDEVLEANNSESVATRRTAFINARQQAEKLAVTFSAEAVLEQRLDELYAALPPVAIPTFKKDET